MILAELISSIRTRVKEYTDDSLYEDSFLWSSFLDERAMLLTQRLKKQHFISSINYSTFCMETVKDLSHMCGCITKVGCEIHRTLLKLPDFLAGRNKPAIELYTLDYGRIDITAERDVLLNKLHPIKAMKPQASIVNNYVILWDTSYPSVLIRMIASDPLEVMEKQQCKEDTPCVDIYTTSINTDREIIEAAIDKVVNNIRQSFEITSDMNNDSNPEIKT
jgi:hypothetical protein